VRTFQEPPNFSSEHAACRILFNFPQSDDRDCKLGQENQYIKVQNASNTRKQLNACILLCPSRIVSAMFGLHACSMLRAVVEMRICFVEHDRRCCLNARTLFQFSHSNTMHVSRRIGAASLTQHNCETPVGAALASVSLGLPCLKLVIATHRTHV
jgi:hypothetical protein